MAGYRESRQKAYRRREIESWNRINQHESEPISIDQDEYAAILTSISNHGVIWQYIGG